MNFHNIKLRLSAASFAQVPIDNMPHIVFAGRSNAGKSSLINKILNRRNFARVSARPGKTATINFYELDERVFLTDLPGYGFASVSKQEQQKWGEFINDYLTGCDKIAYAFLLMDIRHKPSADDLMMTEFFKGMNIPFKIVATKADKLPKTKASASLETIQKSLTVEATQVMPFSIMTGMGVEEIKGIIESIDEQSKKEV